MYVHSVATLNWSPNNHIDKKQNPIIGIRMYTHLFEACTTATSSLPCTFCILMFWCVLKWNFKCQTEREL